MRPVFLLAAFLLAATPVLAAVFFVPAAHAAPALLLSAEVNPAATNVPPQSCPVLLQLHNTTRQAVSMIGRLEGQMGDEGFPSFRAFQFDNLRPGGVATDHINFDGDCLHQSGPDHPAGQIILRGLLMCHEGLANYLDCHSDIGAEPSSGRFAVDIKIDITDWDPGGTGSSLPPGAGIAPLPGH